MFTIRRLSLPLFLFLLLCLKACAPVQTGGTLSPAAPDKAEDAWYRFLAASDTADTLAGPFRISANLYYAGDEGSQRVSAYFWSNGKIGNPRPLRLDIQAGPGSIMASMMEDDRLFRAYVPGDKAVYEHPRSEGSLEAFGVPVPFSLSDLSLLLTGRYRAFFFGEGRNSPSMPPAYTGEDGHIIYNLTDAPFPGQLELGPDGLPVRWSEEDGQGWRMDIAYPEDSTRTTPRRVRFSHAGEREATVTLRELARTAPFSPDSFVLLYPPDAVHRILREK